MIERKTLECFQGRVEVRQSPKDQGKQDGRAHSHTIGEHDRAAGSGATHGHTRPDTRLCM